jgi:predicted signal transduction protein with EAL and GGDEF domain
LGLRILTILAEAGPSPRRLEIELTESALVRDLAGAQDALMALRGAGVRIALDDFGTGYSSLYHLRNFKVDKIKIDRSFVDSMEREPEAYALVRAAWIRPRSGIDGDRRRRGKAGAGDCSAAGRLPTGARLSL